MHISEVALWHPLLYSWLYVLVGASPRSLPVAWSTCFRWNQAHSNLQNLGLQTSQCLRPHALSLVPVAGWIDRPRVAAGPRCHWKIVEVSGVHLSYITVEGERDALYWHNYQSACILYHWQTQHWWLYTHSDKPATFTKCEDTDQLPVLSENFPFVSLQ